MRDKNLAAWDIPVTDKFLDSVRRGVRRRKLLRGAALGGAVLTTAAAFTVAIALTGGSDPTQNGTPPAAPTARPSTADKTLDGFHVTRLPEGAVPAGADSTYTAAVTEQGLRNEDPAPAAGAPKASVTIRRFNRGAGVELYVTVLRPEPGTDPAVGAAQIGDWLARWAVQGGTLVRTLDVPAGTARVLADVGSETTSHRVVISTPGHDVITIEGNAAFTAAELETVARGVTI